MYEYRAAVRRVVDADTVEVMVDLGFSTYRVETLRLAGVDAPERFTPEGIRATGYVQGLLPVGRDVVVQTVKGGNEKYGRYLANIVIDSQSLSALLLKNGHAVPYSGGPR